MSGYRPILPIPSYRGSIRGASGVFSGQSSHPPRRSAIKAACEPCRKRKSRCDGLRPTCSCCKQNEEGNCYYEVEEGQTRTMALKQQVQDLKDIISGIVTAEDKDVVISMVLRLHTNGFRNLDEVASALRDTGSTAGPSEDTLSDDFISSHTLSREGVAPGQSHQPQTADTSAQRIIVDPEQGRIRDENTKEPPILFEESESRYRFAPLKKAEYLKTSGNITFPTLIPIHLFQIANKPDAQPISSRYTDFVSMKKLLIENGRPASDVLGPVVIDPAQLLNTGSTASSGSQTVSNWANGIVQGIDTMCVAEKLATILLITSLARWQISPTLEHYQGISECMRPTPVQIMVSHPAWIDYIPWPEIRDYFIKSPNDLGKGDVHSLLTRHTHINWHSNQDNMLCLSPNTNVLILSDEFQEWGKDINNWSLDHAVVAEFPALADKAWVKDNGVMNDFQKDLRTFQELVSSDWDPTLAYAAAAGL